MNLPIRVFGLRDLLKGLRAARNTTPDALFAEARNCTLCGYCMPCPYGVDIVGVFSVCGFRASRGGFDENCFLEDYEKSVPYLRRADRCIGCGACVSQCPQSICIPEEMRRIDAFTESLKVQRLLGRKRSVRRKPLRGADVKREHR